MKGTSLARSRLIKPGFFTNDVLGECDPLARILFAGLWCHADSEGRLEYRPKKLKAEILPFDKCSVESLMKQLTSRGFVIAYKIGDVTYLQIVTFSKHQHPHHREQPSPIPAPGQPEAGPSLALDETYTSPSLTLNPLTLTLNHNPRPEADTFETFWLHCPRKVGKGGARTAYRRALEKTSPETLLGGITAHAMAMSGKDETYIPHPATWLNQERWNDQPVTNGTGVSERRTPKEPPPALEQEPRIDRDIH